MTSTVFGPNVKEQNRNVTGSRFGDNARSDKNTNNPPKARQRAQIQDFMDEIAATPVPPYDFVRPVFEENLLATEEGIEELRQAKVITAPRIAPWCSSGWKRPGEQRPRAQSTTPC